MQINQEDLQELKHIYHEEYGNTLSDAEALEMGQRLLRLFQIICLPLPDDVRNISTPSIDSFPGEAYDVTGTMINEDS